MKGLGRGERNEDFVMKCLETRCTFNSLLSYVVGITNQGKQSVRESLMSIFFSHMN